MKANDRQAKKSLSIPELEAELHTVQEKMFRLRFKHNVSKLSNPLEIRSLRRHAARLSTWIGQKRRAA